jgi:tRNA(adenine34) deaminase
MKSQAHNADFQFMEKALELAHKAEGLQEVPIGAVVVCDGQIVGEGYNTRETQNNPAGHAELTAIQQAAKTLGRWRLTGCTLYVTLEPCLMCAGAVVLARLDRVVYGPRDPKAGAVHSLYEVLADKRLNHRPEVLEGVMGDECSRILKDFFAKRRQN